MRSLFQICVALTIGLFIGVLLGVIKAIFHRKEYSKKEIESTKKLIMYTANILKYITFAMLVCGLIWCVYFLVLGIVVPSQVDYANNMAELIVAVLTVISIMFAFMEFLKRKD